MADPTSSVLTAASAANPWIGIAGAAAQGLGQALGGGGGPSSAVSRAEAVFDNSGWNLNFGNGDIKSTSDKTASTGAAGLDSISGYVPYIALIVAGVVLWRAMKKS